LKPGGFARGEGLHPFNDRTWKESEGGV
jgi:hypothetical protein